MIFCFFFIHFTLSEEINYTKVIIPPGVYYLNDSYKLTSNTHYVGNGQVRFIGGKVLKGFSKVQSSSILNRLESSVRDSVYECDLLSNGISTIPEFTRRGFGQSWSTSHAHLYIDGEQMNIAQYPKPGQLVKINGLLNGHIRNGFEINDTRIKRWQQANDIWIYGYWQYMWAGYIARASSIDSDNMIIKVDVPSSQSYSQK